MTMIHGNRSRDVVGVVDWMADYQPQLLDDACLQAIK